LAGLLESRAADLAARVFCQFGARRALEKQMECPGGKGPFQPVAFGKMKAQKKKVLRSQPAGLFEPVRRIQLVTVDEPGELPESRIGGACLTGKIMFRDS